MTYEEEMAADAAGYAAEMDEAYGAGNWWWGEGGAAVAPEAAGGAHVLLERAARVVRSAQRAIAAAEEACAAWGADGCFGLEGVFARGRLRGYAPQLREALGDIEILRTAVEASLERACGGDAHARALWERGVQRAGEQPEP